MQTLSRKPTQKFCENCAGAPLHKWSTISAHFDATAHVSHKFSGDLSRLPRAQVRAQLSLAHCMCSNSACVQAKTVVAEIVSELIHSESEVCICNGDIGIRGSLCICDERLSTDIPTDLSVSVMAFILLATRFCICNWNELLTAKMSVCNHTGYYYTEYDRAKVPAYNGNDPHPSLIVQKTLLFPLLLDKVQNRGDAWGASEVRRGTSSIHFHCPAPRSSSHIGHGTTRMSQGWAWKDYPDLELADCVNSSPPWFPKNFRGFGGIWATSGKFGKPRGAERNSVRLCMALHRNSVGNSWKIRDNTGFSWKIWGWDGFWRFGASKGFCANSHLESGYFGLVCCHSASGTLAP